MPSSNISRLSALVLSTSVVASALTSGLVAYFNGDTYQAGTAEVTTVSGATVTAGGGLISMSSSTIEAATISGATLRNTDGTFIADLTDLEVTTTISGSTITTTGELTVLSGATFDTTTFYVNAQANRVGVVNTDPDTALDVVGVISGSALDIKGEFDLLSGATIDTTTLYVNAGTNRVGILTVTPEVALEVAGTMSGQTMKWFTGTGGNTTINAVAAGSGKLTIHGNDGGGFCLQDNDAAGWTICNALNGVLTCSIANATTCP